MSHNPQRKVNDAYTYNVHYRMTELLTELLEYLTSGWD